MISPTSAGAIVQNHREECDDGKSASDDGYSSTCTIEPVAGGGGLTVDGRCPTCGRGALSPTPHLRDTRFHRAPASAALFSTENGATAPPPACS